MMKSGGIILAAIMMLPVTISSNAFGASLLCFEPYQPSCSSYGDNLSPYDINGCQQALESYQRLVADYKSCLEMRKSEDNTVTEKADHIDRKLKETTKEFKCRLGDKDYC